MESDSNFLVSCTRCLPQLALIPVVHAIAPAHWSGSCVVAISWAPRGTLAGGSAAVHGGDAAGPIWTLLVPARISHFCGEDIATHASL